MAMPARIPKRQWARARDRRGLIVAFAAALLLWRFLVIGPIESLLNLLR
jgi:hypothetical protein